MEELESRFMKSDSIYWEQVINREVKKSQFPLQPIFEAFTNSLEAIKDLQKIQINTVGRIEVEIYATNSTDGENFNFDYFKISDNGIGFNTKEFDRFLRYLDNRKNYNNRGSGRLQFLHFFGYTTINSKFLEENKYYEREFTISKNPVYIQNNSIVKQEFCKETNITENKTTVQFSELLVNHNIYNTLNAESLKEKILDRYLPLFCQMKNTIPEISIKFFVEKTLKQTVYIKESDIPLPDKSFNFETQYCSCKSGVITKSEKKETFHVDSFKMPEKILDENKAQLVSKGEVVISTNVKIEFIDPKERIKKYRYLFYISSSYIDNLDTSNRGQIEFPSRNKKQNSAFDEDEVIYLEDLNEVFNEKVRDIYPEFSKLVEMQAERVKELQRMFLLDEETIKDLKFSVNDNDTEILSKIYTKAAVKNANSDASIKRKFESLKALDTTAVDYQEKLEKYANEIVNELPIQNKNALSKYIARRNIVLRMFDYILNNELDIQNDKNRNKNESLLHNLIFQQRSNSPQDSDLWLLNEEFIYFKGTSDVRIENLEIDGIKIFKEEFSIEEKKHIEAFGENRMLNRPDILLFPEEGKCIIIELKSPEVNASNHLAQIDKYASLIRNYTSEKFQLTTFYGYLIAENIDERDVRGAVSSFEFSYHFDFLFRPSIKVTGFDGRNDGTIYTEVIKYSTLLKRAKLRNKIFIKKLGFEYDSELDTL